MKKLLFLLLLCLTFSTRANSQTATVTGHVLFPSAGAPGNAQVCFTLQNYKPNIPRIIATGTVIQQQNWCITPSSTDGSFSVPIFRNDFLSPIGTFWRVDFLANGIQQSSATYIINTDPFNLDTATPLSTTPPAGPNQIITQCFSFLQSTPATTWTINHNENDQYVFVQTTDLNGNIIFPDSVNLSNPNAAVVNWIVAQAGRALACHGGGINIATNQPNAVVTNPIGPQTIAGNGSQALNIQTPYNTTAAGTHSGTETFTNLNNVQWAGPGATPTVDQAIAALGSNPGTVMISANYSGPESTNLTFNAVDGSTYTIYRGSNNITVHDLRASTNKAYGVNYGGTTLGSQARFAVTQSITSPTTTTSAILGTQQVTGNIAGGAGNGAMASGTFELDTEGAVTTGSNIIQALNGQFGIRSTGGTLPLVVGLEAGGGVDRDAGAGMTNITTAVGVQGDAIVNVAPSHSTIQDTFGVRGFQSTVGTRNNFAIVSEGNMMFKDNGCIYGENGSSPALQLLCFGIDNTATGGGNIYSTTNSPAAWKYIVNGSHFNWLAGPQVNLSNAFEITPSTAANGTTFSFPAFSISSVGVLGLANGTANQYLFTPAAPSASRTISISDPGATTGLGLSYNSTNPVYQSKRGVAGCTTGAAAGNSCGTDITVTWGTAFPDANYSVTCTGSAPTNVPSGPFVVSGTKLAATVHINYFAITAAAASYSTIDCIAIHD